MDKKEKSIKTYKMLVMEARTGPNKTLQVGTIGVEVSSRDIKTQTFSEKVISFYFFDIETTVTTDDDFVETVESSEPVHLSAHMFMPGRGTVWNVKDLTGRRDETSLATLTNLLEHGLECGFLDTRTRQMFEFDADSGDRILAEDEVTMSTPPTKAN